MVKQYYAVAKGRVPGIYLDKTSCMAQVLNYPGNRYKVFGDLNAAANYIDSVNKDSRKNGEHVGVSVNISNTIDRVMSSEEVLSDEELSDIIYNRDIRIREGAYGADQGFSISKRCSEPVIIPQDIYNSTKIYVYTDGSYIKHQNYAGWAFVVLPNRKYGINRIIKVYGCCPSMEYSNNYRNIYGELEAVINALMFLQSKHGNNFSVRILHDLEGVAGWADNWKKNNVLTKEYSEMIYNYRMSGIKINFQKVSAHSGDLFNGIADKLARSAIKELNPGSYRIES